MSEVYDLYVDTAGNYHYTDTETGHHVIPNMAVGSFQPPHLIKTNADRIRSMTDAELAEWFGMSERMCPDGFAETTDCDACPEICTGHWLLWLKEEVKDDNQQI